MTKDEFSRLFSDALNHAAISAEARLGIKIPRWAGLSPLPKNPPQSNEIILEFSRVC